jgi:hypothetical protein
LLGDDEAVLVAAENDRRSKFRRGETLAAHLEKRFVTARQSEKLLRIGLAG